MRVGDDDREGAWLVLVLVRMPALAPTEMCSRVFRVKPTVRRERVGASAPTEADAYYRHKHDDAGGDHDDGMGWAGWNSWDGEATGMCWPKYHVSKSRARTRGIHASCCQKAYYRHAASAWSYLEPWPVAAKRQFPRTGRRGTINKASDSNKRAGLVPVLPSIAYSRGGDEALGRTFWMESHERMGRLAQVRNVYPM